MPGLRHRRGWRAGRAGRAGNGSASTPCFRHTPLRTAGRLQTTTAPWVQQGAVDTQPTAQGNGEEPSVLTSLRTPHPRIPASSPGPTPAGKSPHHGPAQSRAGHQFPCSRRPRPRCLQHPRSRRRHLVDHPPLSPHRARPPGPARRTLQRAGPQGRPLPRRRQGGQPPAPTPRRQPQQGRPKVSRHRPAPPYPPTPAAAPKRRYAAPTSEPVRRRHHPGATHRLRTATRAPHRSASQPQPRHHPRPTAASTASAGDNKPGRTAAKPATPPC